MFYENDFDLLLVDDITVYVWSFGYRVFQPQLDNYRQF